MPKHNNRMECLGRIIKVKSHFTVILLNNIFYTTHTESMKLWIRFLVGKRLPFLSIGFTRQESMSVIMVMLFFSFLKTLSSIKGLTVFSADSTALSMRLPKSTLRSSYVTKSIHLLLISMCSAIFCVRHIFW